MQNSKYVWMAMVVVAIIALGSYQFPRVQQTVNQVLGAVSSLDGVDNGSVSINGYKEFYFTNTLTATSSFICSFQNPYQATSSIVAVGAQATNAGVAEANNLYISTSTTAYGTSTTALVQAFPMGTGQWTVELEKNSATTSVTNVTLGGVPVDLLPGRTNTGASNYILGPTEFITWKIATTTGGTYTTYDVGVCTARVKRM